MTPDNAIGIDLGGSFIKAGIINPQGQIIVFEKEATEALDFERVCAQIASIVTRLKKNHPVRGVGIAVPGGICVDRETVSQSPNFPDWHMVNLRQGLKDQGLDRVWIDNDANLAGFGENWCGAGREEPHMGMFTLGTGVGGAIILDRKIWHGAFGMAGELGHITVYSEGRICGCGNRGCLEQYAGASALVKRALTLMQEGEMRRLAAICGNDPELISPKLIFQAAQEGDSGCIHLFHEAGRALGIVIAGLINSLGLPLFAIGGGMCPCFPAIEPSIRHEINKRAFRIPAAGTKIVPAELGNRAGIIGAARLVFQQEARG